jgi:hypothetical protein
VAHSLSVEASRSHELKAIASRQSLINMVHAHHFKAGPGSKEDLLMSSLFL